MKEKITYKTNEERVKDYFNRLTYKDIPGLYGYFGLNGHRSICGVFLIPKIKIRNVIDVENISVGTNMYRLELDYKNKLLFGEEMRGSVFLKESAGETRDYNGEITHDKVTYEANLLYYLKGSGGPVPKHIDFYKDPDKNLIFLIEEDFGDNSLEKILLERGNKRSILYNLQERVAVALAEFHSMLEKSDMGTYFSIRKQGNYFTKLVNYIEVLSGKKLDKSEKNELANYSERLIEIINKEPKQLIHGDLHLSNILLFEDQIKFIDLSSVSVGPVAFDIVDLIKYPLVNLSLDDEMKLVKTYAEAIGKKNFTIELLPVVNLFRSIRNATKPVLLKKKHPSKYESHLRFNKYYANHTDLYLSDVGEVLNHLTQNSSFYNLDGIIKLRDFLVRRIPGLEIPKEPIIISKKQENNSISRRGLIGAAISALFCGNKLK